MEAENQLYAEKHGDRQGQPPPADRPQYTPTPEQQQQQQPGQFQGFPPYAASTTAAASPYYAAPSGAGYAGGYGVPPASQQQQQQVTIVTANQAPTVYVQHVESYTGASGVTRILTQGGHKPSSFPPLPFPSLYPALPIPFPPSLPLEVGPLKSS